ncbi:hypothetical protein JCM11641_004026 [Rhodosporidiobolus odoratus]
MKTLSIITYNINRQQLVLTRLLHNPATACIDILLLQEPPHTLPTSLPFGWTVLAPSPPFSPRADEKITHIRAIALVHPRVSHLVQQVAAASPDLVALDVVLQEPKSAREKEVRIRVVGLYNLAAADAHHNTTVEQALLPALSARPVPTHRFVAGDFNLRHPLWEKERTSVPSAAAEAAIEILSSASLNLLLPPDTTTFFSHNKRDRGTLDLVFADLRTSERMVSCGVADELESGSDHRPVSTVIEIEVPPPRPFLPRPLFRKADPATVKAGFAVFDTLIPPPVSLSTQQEVNKEGEQLTQILSYTSIATVPYSRNAPCGKANSWWSEIIAEACRDARQKANKAYRLRKLTKRGGEREGDADAARIAATSARNRVKALCRRAQNEEELDRWRKVKPENLWNEVKRVKGEPETAPPTPPPRKEDGTYATNDGEKLRVVQPFLLPRHQARRGATDLERSGRRERSQTEAFVGAGDAAEGKDVKKPPRPSRTNATPPIPPSEPSLPPSSNVLPWPDLEEEEVRNALFSSRSFAAPGADGLPNAFLQLLWPLLRTRIVRLFRLID